MKLQGKVAIVTGGAQGLGRGFAQALLGKRAKVCICDVNSTTGQTTLAAWNKQFGKDNCMFLKCDVTEHDQFEGVIKKVIKEFGGLDILVNNAGVIGEEPGNWRRTIQINLIGVIEGTRLAETYMDKTAGGRGGLVVNISSTAGLIPIIHGPVYSGSKYGVVGYTTSMAVSGIHHKYGVVGYTTSMAAHPKVSETGVSYVTLCPAFTATELFEENHAALQNDRSSSDSMMKQVTDVGIQTVTDVVKGFLQLVEADNNNGFVMAVSKQKGIHYAHRRSRKPQTNKL